MEILTCAEGFSLRYSLSGWQWQETGAEGWSNGYSTRQAAIDAIKAEFPCVPIILNAGAA